MKRIRYHVITLATLAGLGIISCGTLFNPRRPEALPRTSDTVPVQVRFQGRAPGPTDKEMFVCGRVGPDNEFWCVDYFLFQQHVSAQ